MMSVTTACAVILLAFAVHVMAIVYTSDGQSGSICGNRKCVKGQAFCVNGTNPDGTGPNGTCKCKKKYFYGKGILNCYRKSEIRTEVTNDPRVDTYNHIGYDLPIPCRYLLTHIISDFKNKRKNKRDVLGVCELMLYVFHGKALGKFFVYGIDVAIRVEMNNGSRFQWSIRMYGEAHMGNYTFIVNSTNGHFFPNGPWYNDTVDFYDSRTGLKIEVKIDEVNNLGIIVAKQCGWRIRYRPYDRDLKRDQLQVPGMTVVSSCAYSPQFDSVDEVMSPPHTSIHNGYTVHSIKIPGLSVMETMIYRAFVSDVDQIQPGGNEACEDARTSVMRCNLYGELQLAFYRCIWILRSPRFIRCYDKTKNGVSILRLFNSCVDIYCNKANCNYVIGMVNTTTCGTTPGYPMLQQFINGSYCP